MPVHQLQHLNSREPGTRNRQLTGGRDLSLTVYLTLMEPPISVRVAPMNEATT